MPVWPTNLTSDYFAIAKQTAQGTEGTTFIFPKHLDGTALELDVDVVSEREGGDGQEVGLRYKSLIKMDGNLNANARSEISAYGFAGVLGKTAATTVADGAAIPSGCIKFTFAPNPTLPYFTVEQRYADQIERISDAKFTSLDIEGEAGRAAKLTFSIVGGGTPYRRDIASALTPARESGDPVYFPRGSYVLDGTANGDLTKFKASLKRSVDDGIQTTQLFRADVVELNADYDLDFTLKYTSATLYNKVQYSLGSMVDIGLATGAFSAFMSNGAAGTLLRSVKVAFPLIQYAGARVNKLDPDGKTVYIDVSAMTIKAATDSVVAEVVVASRAGIV